MSCVLVSVSSVLYLYELLQVFWSHAGEVGQEVAACRLQLHVLPLLLRSLQGAEHDGPQHQVEQHPGQDAEQGGAAHGYTSAQSRRLLLFASAGAARSPAAAAETTAAHTHTLRV